MPSPELPEQQRVEFNRLIWHSRRGMLELDILLEPFVKERYLLLDEALQTDYRELLGCEDQQLFDWLLKKQSPLARFEGIVTEILRYATASSG